MDNQSALAVREALWMALQLAGPPLIAMLAVGLVISVFQALTQIQEATLAFLPKLVVLGVVLLLLGPSMVGSMRGYAASLFDRMVAVGGQP
ncbi:flagellar biosynthesis protein FliQ [Belnapia rosea]|uniref:Flagellar biosynthetic protein FliQ n=1 Tax=Belnapia rosea TaxID=938405 RepID=A0A1G6PDF9_9PROT|nr:flagellar biosynthesis protein FliQ [Belnapia rosea]SDB54603.1 flagellar biosynthetic protein FliQ [Belnapia rosea]SDC78031.1 flagellar biosynthetic protein FliQ [Belnapia rosea]